MNCKLYQKIIILLLFLFFSNILWGQANSKIIFRIDDFGNDNTEFYYKLFDLFQSYNFPLTVGVIPFEEDASRIVALDSTEIRLLRKGISDGYLEIAQHGYTHENIINGKSFKSEFYGFPYKVQYKKILSGKNTLEKQLDCKINIFIPPFNNYDSTTIKVLEKTGFDILSPALYGKVNMCKTNISIIPYTVTLKDFLKNKNKILEDLSINNRIVIILFHTYNFYCNEEYFKKHSKYKLIPFLSFKEFSKLINQISLIDNIEITNFNNIEKSNIFSYGKYKRQFKNVGLIRTPDVNILNEENYYYGQKFYNTFEKIFAVYIYPILFYLVSFLLPFLITKFMINFLKLKKKVLYYSFLFILTLMILSVFYTLKDGNLGLKSITFLIICLGLLLGFVNHIYVSKRRNNV